MDYADMTYSVGIKLPLLCAMGGITFILMLLSIVCWWKIFTKAGEPAWMSVIPFLNTFKKYEIACGSGWKMFIAWIPVVGWIYSIIATNKLSKAFGYNAMLTVLYLFATPVAVFILAFGNNDYYGPY